MSTATDILLWAQRVIAKRGSPAHVLLEVKADATVEDAQAAFHKIARKAHPDLHRNALAEDELELVTSAYSVIAGAYQTFRASLMTTTQIKTVGGEVPVTPSGIAPVSGAAGAMTSRALVYYRKAELALRQGDLRGAILQLKMAIGADPGSPLLRTALAEVESELRKGT